MAGARCGRLEVCPPRRRELDATERRLLRLRHELDDDGIWLPADDDLCSLLLAELDYARHPHAHEGVAPRYGALLATPAALRQQPVEQLELVDISAIPLGVARRLADGRSSFVARVVGGPDRLVCFDRTREYESSAVHLTTATGALVVQRLGPGLGPADDARRRGDLGRHPLVDEAAVDGSSSSGSRRTRRTPTPSCWPTCSSCARTGWRAGRVGATLVWRLDGDPHELAGLGLQAVGDDPAARPPPPLALRRAAQRPVPVRPRRARRPGRARRARRRPPAVVRAVAGARSRRTAAPATRRRCGSRPTSRAPIVFVVSSNGTLSVFAGGERLPIRLIEPPDAVTGADGHRAAPGHHVAGAGRCRIRVTPTPRRRCSRRRR